jgi:gallate decarboxylase subunit D
MTTARCSAKEGRFRIDALVQSLGEDLLVSVWGGTRPHIGAVGMAVPRPSLADPQHTSATSSNYTFLGHKEDVVVKQVSETISAALGKNVVVTAGIHWDNLSPRDLVVIAGLTRRLAETIIRQQQSARGRHRRKK